MIDFLTGNWLWLAALAAMVFMHLGGHGCGGHGRRHHHSDTDATHATGERPSPPQSGDRPAETTTAPQARPPHHNR